MRMSDRVYTILKYLCQVFLPAFGGLYFGLAQLWNLPYAEQIVGSCSCVAAFIGILIGVSSYQYYKEAENERN